ncbi:MAG: universal stress protein [Nitrospirota bacterium]
MISLKKIAMKFENVMTAVTFAEAGEAETARNIIKESEIAAQMTKAVTATSGSFAKKHDTTMEAITFAEAGEHDHAHALLKAAKAEKETEREKIIVVGYEEGFSEKLVSYALSMADRMNYEIAALNVIPVGRRLFSALNDRVKDELKTNTEKGAEAFRARASEKNILFTHTVKFGDTDRTINELCRELKRVTFILTEPEHLSGEEAANANIPVFCLSEA